MSEKKMSIFQKMKAMFKGKPSGTVVKSKSKKDEKLAFEMNENMEEEALKAAFDRFDTNGDGVIDKKELSELLVEFLSLKEVPSENQIARIMSQVDLDMNGSIDYKEFKIMLKGRTDTKKQYITTFNNFDTNGDGYITPDELKQCMRKVHPNTTDAEIAQIMEAVDSNKDGKISFQEFLDYFVV